MVKEITLTQSQVALVDDEDYPWLSTMAWGCLVGRKGYAYRTSDGKTIYMHRLIMQAPHGMEVDHINGDTLDNRRENLRLATRRQNAQNSPKPHRKKTSKGSSQYKGVQFRRQYMGSDKRWVAMIKGRYLGSFATEEEAAHAYDAAARAEFGPFAWLNFPEAEAGAPAL